MSRLPISLNDVAAAVERDPTGSLAKDLKEEPAKTLRRLADASPIYQRDRLIYRVVVIGLVAVALLALVGIFALLIREKKEVESLTAICSAAVGGLVGLLAPSPAQH